MAKIKKARIIGVRQFPTHEIVEIRVPLNEEHSTTQRLLQKYETVFTLDHFLDSENEK